MNTIIPPGARRRSSRQEPGQKYTTGDYTVVERTHSCALTEGRGKVRALLNVQTCTTEYIELNHHVQRALRAMLWRPRCR
ncbi:MAG: hypothetical protein HS123_15745 [Solibacteraceae bacterium]|nr:hypothetical protein [Solibacteraceae bacterium]